MGAAPPQPDRFAGVIRNFGSFLGGALAPVVTGFFTQTSVVRTDAVDGSRHCVCRGDGPFGGAQTDSRTRTRGGCGPRAQLRGVRVTTGVAYLYRRLITLFQRYISRPSQIESRVATH